MKFRKSQTEMLGIAIVVILISIGILFIVSNSISKAGQQSTKAEFSEKQLATNILSAMLQTSTSCQNDRISTLMIDCGNGVTRPQPCGGETIQGVYIPETPYPCAYLNDTISLILNSTLKKWNRKYQFLAYTNTIDLPKINISSRINECLSGTGTGLKYVQKDSYYLPLYPDTMTVELSLCS